MSRYRFICTFFLSVETRSLALERCVTHLQSERLEAVCSELAGTSRTGGLLASPDSLELLSLLRVWKMRSGLLKTAPAACSESHCQH